MPCTVFKATRNTLLIHVHEPQRAVTAGQVNHQMYQILPSIIIHIIFFLLL